METLYILQFLFEDSWRNIASSVENPRNLIASEMIALRMSRDFPDIPFRIIDTTGKFIRPGIYLGFSAMDDYGPGDDTIPF